MKKVLFINSSLNSGGSEKVMTLLANQFAEMGIDTTMLLIRDKIPDIYQVNSKVKLIRFCYNTKNKLIIAVKRVMRLRKLVRDDSFDCVISFMFDINLTVLMALYGLKIPVIVSERADPSQRNHTKIYKAIETFFYNHAKNIVLQTEQVKQMFPKKLMERCVVVPNPIDIQLPVSAFHSRSKIILAAGRLTEQKNFSMLIRAYSKIRTKYKGYKLVIYGEGPMEYQLKELVKQLNIQDDVEFPGFTNDLAGEMSKAYMYVSTSDFEGISNSMLEALAIGLPCICTNCPVGGAEMMIQDGYNGFLVNVGDEDGVCKAMERILCDEKTAKTLGDNAINVRDCYSIEVVAKVWLELVEKA